MIKKMILLIGGITIGLLLIVLLTAEAQKHDAALIVRGEIYRVIWTCHQATVFAGQPDPVAAFKGCYGEWLKIEAPRSDGWAEVLECSGVEQRAPKCEAANRWLVNLAIAQALRPYGTTRAAN